MGLGKELLALLEKDQWFVCEISRSGNSRHGIAFDLARTGEIDDLIQRVDALVPPGDVSEALFVNNAGRIVPIQRASNVSPEDLLASLRVNVESPLVLMRHFLQRFRGARIRKTIVNVSSGAANKGYAGWSLYCAGKASVENYLAAVHEEEKTEPHPFRVFTVNPYVMDTGMQRSIRASEESQFPQRSRFVGFKEKNQLLAPRAVAGAIMDLVRDDRFADFRFDAKSHLGA